MLTIDMLKAFGANTDEGMARCMNNESFYLRMVGMGIDDPNFDKLPEAIAADNAKEAFEAAHALKGVMGNLSLTPLFEPLSRLTELLRGQDEVGDVDALLEQILGQLENIRALDA